MSPEVEDILSLWKTRRKVLQQITHVDTGAIVYELTKCIEGLENEFRANTLGSSPSMDAGGPQRPGSK